MTRTTYLVESYWPDITPAAYHDAAARAAATGSLLLAEGHDVEFLGSVLVPGDEVVFWRFASATRALVEEACAQARLPSDRVLECIEVFAAAQVTPRWRTEPRQ